MISENIMWQLVCVVALLLRSRAVGVAERMLARHRAMPLLDSLVYTIGSESVIPRFTICHRASGHAAFVGHTTQ
jgi:hypothetical protein